MLRFIARRDHRIMRRVHSWRPPRWVRWWMLAATRGGDGWLWLLLGLLVALYAGPEALAALAAAGVATIAGITLFMYLKRKTGRKRPCAIMPHCWSRIQPPDHFSFPSGHSITAFAVTLPIGLFFPPLMAALLFCAISVAASRVILGMHFLSDVLAGSAIGSALGYAAFRLFS